MHNNCKNQNITYKMCSNSIFTAYNFTAQTFQSYAKQKNKILLLLILDERFGKSCSAAADCKTNAKCNNIKVCQCREKFYRDTTSGDCVGKLSALMFIICFFLENINYLIFYNVEKFLLPEKKVLRSVRHFNY